MPVMPDTGSAPFSWNRGKPKLDLVWYMLLLAASTCCVGCPLPCCQPRGLSCTTCSLPCSLPYGQLHADRCLPCCQTCSLFCAAC